MMCGACPYSSELQSCGGSLRRRFIWATWYGTGSRRGAMTGKFPSRTFRRSCCPANRQATDWGKQGELHRDSMRRMFAFWASIVIAGVFVLMAVSYYLSGIRASYVAIHLGSTACHG